MEKGNQSILVISNKQILFSNEVFTEEQEQKRELGMNYVCWKDGIELIQLDSEQ